MNVDSERVDDARDLTIEATGQSIRARCYHLPVGDKAGFDIYVNPEEADDAITEAIVRHTYTFPESFWLMDALLQPGQRVLDLGAHIGTFSLFAAALGYTVASVEASPRNAALLIASARRNAFDDMQVVPAAVSDHAGTLEFVYCGPYSFVASESKESHSDLPTVSVPAVTADGLLADTGWDGVDLVKMDVEGSEVAAIRGMPELLAGDDAPLLLYESNGSMLHRFGESPGSLMEALEAYGYHSYLVELGRLIPTQSTDLQPDVCVDYLATKRPLDRLGDWRVTAPMSDEERVRRILLSSIHSNRNVRDYIARALTDAEPSILSDHRVLDALKNLALDQDGDARIVELRQALCEKEEEIARLRAMVEGYERGRFIRTMKRLHHVWHRAKGWIEQL